MHPDRSRTRLLLGLLLVPLLVGCGGQGEELTQSFVTQMRDELNNRAVRSAATTAVAGASAASSPSPEAATTAPLVTLDSWAIPDGHFFRQIKGDGAIGQAAGFSVTNHDKIPMLDAFWAYGGERALGRPLSRRFVLNGRVTQVFERLVLQWNQGSGRVEPMNVLDDLSRAGRDAWLHSTHRIPLPVPAAFDQGQSWADVARKRLDLLTRRPATRAFYFGLADPLAFLGLPASEPLDLGDHVAIRFQRGVLREWTRDTADHRAGEVSVVDVGALLVELGIVPTPALALEDQSGVIAYIDSTDDNATAAPPAAAGVPGRIVSPRGDSIRLRLFPDGETIALLNAGPVEILSREHVLGWVRIRAPEGTGWVHQDYVRSDPTAVLPKPKPSPAAQRAPAPNQGTLRVANTGGDGVFLRRTPSLDDRAIAWNDGTPMRVVGEPVKGDGIEWLPVEDPRGNRGFIPRQYLVP